MFLMLVLALLPTPPCGSAFVPAGSLTEPAPMDDPDLCEGWPVTVNTPGGGFPYTPTLFDLTGNGCDEVFFTGGHTFGLSGDGSFLPGWPVTEMAYMGYGTNDQMPGPSCADMTGSGGNAVLWSERDWYAGSAYMWSFNGRLPDGGNLGSFPHHAPDQFSNALASPFVLGDPDGEGYLEAWSAHTLGNTGDYFRISGFDHNGSLLFTRDLDPAEQILCIYFGDLEGDGQEEFLAVTLLSGTFLLYSFEPDGQTTSGYPVELFSLGGGYLMFGPPVIADLDGDNDLEIILGYNLGTSSYAQARHHDGSAVTGFPVNIATQSQLFYLCLGDMTGDQVPELIALDNHLGSAYRAHAIAMGTGTPLPGWPVPVPDWPKGFPTLVDVDNDGLQEMVFVTDGGKLYALAEDGGTIEGYPKTMSAPSISGVAAGDIDGDGLYELVAVTWNGWAYAWNTTGEVGANRADWPMRGVDPRNTGVFTGSGGSTGVTPPETPSPDITTALNPARGNVKFLVPGNTGGTISVFDAAGRLVAEITAGGEEQADWCPGSSVRSGVYLALLRSPSGSAATRFILLR